MAISYVGVLGVLTFGVLDFSSILFFFIYEAKDTTSLRQEIFHFNYGYSTFDFVLLAVLRLSVLIGTTIGVICNSVHAVKRLKDWQVSTTYFGCLQAMYVVAKILAFSEDHPNHVPKRFWALVALTLCSSVTFFLCWRILSSFCRRSRLQKHGELNVNEGEGDAQSQPSGGDDKNNEGKMNAEDKVLADQQSSFSMIINLFKMAGPDMPFILLALLFLIICSVSQAIMPYYTGEVINYIVIDKSIEKFNRALLFMALITLLAGFAAGCRAGLFTFVIGRYTLRLQYKLFSCLTSMEIGFFDVRKTGELTSRLTSDCTKIGDGIGLRFNIFTRSVVRIMGILFFMIKLSWKLSTVTLVAVPVIAIVSKYFGAKYDKVSEQVQNALAKANSSAEEVISSMRTVRSFAAEKSEAGRYWEKLQNTLDCIKKETVIACGYRWSTEMTSFIMTLLILYYGGHLVVTGGLSGGNLVSFILYSFELTYSIQDIGNVFTGLMEVVGASRKVFFYINRKPLVDTNGTLAPPTGINGHIEFRNVSFCYPSRKDVNVLTDLSFTARKGEVVALVGASGGGKSSVINLLQHFYQPTLGQVLIDGIPVVDYQHNFLHRTMSIVQQEPVLFARSISENIKYGLGSEVAHTEVESAAMLANAHSFISAMPDEYRTETGEKGVQLSGGQKQRIAIARALIRNPTILLLDEATSALDSESEHLVQQAINENLTGKTVIVIAHRLSTIEKADKILVINKGRIVEMGSHNQLLEKNGEYASLVSKQVIGPHNDVVCKEASEDDDQKKREVVVSRSISRQISRTSSVKSRGSASSLVLQGSSPTDVII